MTHPRSNDSTPGQQRPRPSRPAESAVITVNASGRILYWSRAAQQTLGYEAPEVKGRNVARLLDPSTLERQLSMLSRAIAVPSPEAAPVHVTARHKDGSLRELEVSIDRWGWEGETYFSVLLSDRARGAPTAQTYDDVFITVTDILARSERFEAAVPLLLPALAQAIGWTSAAIWMADRDRKMLTCRHFWPPERGVLAPFREATMSIAFLPGVGLPGRVWADGESIWIDDVTSSRGFLRGPAADESEIATALAFPIVTGREVIGVIELHCSERRVRDPSLLHLLVHVGSHIGLFIEREAATEALRASEETYRELFEHSLAGVFCLQVDGTIAECNTAFASMFGYPTPQEVFGVPFENLLTQPAEWRTIAAGIAVRGSMPNREISARRRDGSAFWMLLNATAMDGLDARRSTLGTVVDIEVQKRAEREVRELARTLNEAQRFAHVGSFERNLANGKSRWSDEMYRIVGLEPGSPRAGYEYILERMRPSDREEFERAFEEGIERGVPIDLKFRLVRGDGERVLRVQAAVVEEGSGRPKRITGKVLDITDDERATEERLHLQRQLDETRRMSSLGRLAATMAHEFNNMLMGVDSSVELLRRRVVAPEAQAAVGRIQQSLTRGRRITSEILRFTRDATPQLAMVDVRRWLTHFMPEAAALTNDRAQLDADDGLFIRGDIQQLNQVLANLMINARDASGDRAPIRIGARRMAAESSGLSAEALDLAVIDEGGGIPREILDRIFEPLFTTKGHGTGLGLAVVHQVITAHGGVVRVRSEVGYGTEFHLILPLVEAIQFDDLPDDVVIGTADEELRRQLCDLLAMSGVRVRAVQHGVEVLIDVELAPPEALVLDLGLARGNEPDARLDLTDKWPELAVVFLTGRGDEADVARLGVRPRVAFLRKPARAEEVVSALRRLFRRR
jgi:two-component system cell cycle sensor histidine kinase/response regulator CckA